MTHLSQENENIVIWHGCLLIVEVKLCLISFAVFPEKNVLHGN
jgi:hypothetical protein